MDLNDEPQIIRVLIADDHDVVREGLAGFLDTLDDLELIGQARNGAEATRLAADLNPDVILMDLQMPGIDGIEATRAIRTANPAARIVILSSFGQEDEVKAALEAGALGYLLKDSSIHRLSAAIRAAYVGESSLSPQVMQTLLRSSREEPATDYDLKTREVEVLTLMAAGRTNRQIAQDLSLSLSTVKFHVSNILSKLQVESRTEAVALAIQQNLISREGDK